jgi:hypothetical protein
MIINYELKMNNKQVNKKYLMMYNKKYLKYQALELLNFNVIVDVNQY